MKLQVKNKEVNGHLFRWADDIQAYELPLPMPGKVRMVLDEKTNEVQPYKSEVQRQEVAAQVPSGEVTHRERMASYPDGTTYTERLFFAPTSDELDAKQRMIEAKQLQLFESAVDGLLKFRLLFGLGVAVASIAFFYSITIALYGCGGMVALKVNQAFSEVAYYAVYLLSFVFLIIFLRYGMPLLLGAKFIKPNDTSDPEAALPGAGSGGDVYINVQNMRHGSAQEMINKRLV